MNLSTLRRMIREELSRLDEISFNQARVDKPLTQFVQHLNMAKADLGELFQQTSDKQAADKATELLNQLNAIIKSLDHSPELTKDPWAHVSKRG